MSNELDVMVRGAADLRHDGVEDDERPLQAGHAGDVHPDVWVAQRATGPQHAGHKDGGRQVGADEDEGGARPACTRT